MAEQTTPVERRVALKIIKPGMDTRQVVARFEAERQALAMMDHPNPSVAEKRRTIGNPSSIYDENSGTTPVRTFHEPWHPRAVRKQRIEPTLDGLPIPSYSEKASRQNPVGIFSSVGETHELTNVVIRVCTFGKDTQTAQRPRAEYHGCFWASRLFR